MEFLRGAPIVVHASTAPVHLNRGAAAFHAPGFDVPVQLLEVVDVSPSGYRAKILKDITGALMRKKPHRYSATSDNLLVLMITISILVRVLHLYSKYCITGIDPWYLAAQARAEPRPEADPSPATRGVRRLTVAEIDTLVERYEALRSLRKVSSELGLDRATARAHLASRGVVLRPKASMSTADIARAVELYVAGKSSAAIGKALGFDNKTVLKELLAAGVGIRPRGGY